jgi:hypothetical protein
MSTLTLSLNVDIDIVIGVEIASNLTVDMIGIEVGELKLALNLAVESWICNMYVWYSKIIGCMST